MTQSDLPESEQSPVFTVVLPTPITIVETKSHAILEGDLVSEADYNEILKLMFAFPEREFRLYLQEKNTNNKSIIETFEKSGILVERTEYYYYPLPKYPRHFVNVAPGKEDFPWQQELAENELMYGKSSLKLSESKKRELEIKQKISIEKSIVSNPLDLKPNFFGFGVDLKKIPAWLGKITKKKKS